MRDKKPPEQIKLGASAAAIAWAELNRFDQAIIFRKWPVLASALTAEAYG